MREYERQLTAATDNNNNDGNNSSSRGSSSSTATVIEIVYNTHTLLHLTVAVGSAGVARTRIHTPESRTLLSRECCEIVLHVLANIQKRHKHTQHQ